MIKVYDFFKSDFEEICIVMEYPGSYSLKAIVKDMANVFKNHQRFA